MIKNIAIAFFVIAKKDVPLVHASQITRSLVLRILSSSFFAS